MSTLFTPIQLGGVTLPNRIVVAPMCQYSANDGCMSDWHMIHLGSLAVSGAGLTMVEATGVTREGRISHGCTGMYSDDNEAAMARVVAAYRRISRSPIGIQLGHAGRKASAQLPWGGGGALRTTESPWQTVAPSALPFGEGWHTPREAAGEDLRALVDAFAAAAQRALRAGFDVVELHAAHGYLLHQFLSPVSNQRTDAYGGNREKRMRFPLEAARALREALGSGFLVVSPGIRPIERRDDQKRVVTPRDAFLAGADYIVVGRPIIAAPDPAAACRHIIDRMNGA